MTFDVKTFRRALGCFASGIAVVTGVTVDGRDVGITINSFTSVSLEPPLVLYCLGRESLVHPALSASRAFAINVLAEDQRALSLHFSRSATQHRWDDIEITRGDGGVPLLVGSIAQLECTLETIHPGGDHDIMVGRVHRLDYHGEARPLLYFRGRYGRLDEVLVP